MNLIPKQQVDIDIANIEASANTFTNAINAAIFSLNNSHQALWSLPEDRLTAVLQKLYDNNELLSLFADHNYSAVSLNEIQVRSKNITANKAIDTAGRDFQIVDGVVSLVPIAEVIVEQLIEESVEQSVEQPIIE